MADLQSANAAAQGAVRQSTSDNDHQALARRLHGAAESDPDLARLVDAWPGLPPHIKAAIVALLGTAG